MPHRRKRRLLEAALSDLKWSPAVGVYGLRQVGKTTLLEEIAAARGTRLETFDREATLQASRENPLGFCSREGTLCLDEAQKGPWIFPAIKELIGTRRRPGSFMLTGSVRFTARKEIREALTGRVVLRELLPFDVSEAHGLSGSEFLEGVFRIVGADPSGRRLRQAWEQREVIRKGLSLESVLRHYRVGGMPIACFTREEARRLQWYQGYFETLLTRDLGLVDEKLLGLPYRQLQAFLRVLALAQGKEVQYSDFSSQVAVRPALVKSLLNAFETLAVVDRVVPEIRGTRPVRKLRIEWKDVGLWRFAAGISELGRRIEGLGASVFIAQELRSQAYRMSPQPSWSFFRSHDGANVPWIFRSGDVAVALTFIPVESPEPFEIRSLRGFIETERKAIGIVLGSPSAAVTEIATRVWLVPYPMIF